MVAVSKRYRKWAVALLAVLLGCLAAPAHADESQFFPAGTDMVFSINVPALLKSDTFGALKNKYMTSPDFKNVREIYEKLNKGKEVTLDTYVDLFSVVPLANIDRYTTAGKAGGQRKAAQAQIAQVQISTLTQATQAYKIKHNEYPPTLAELLKKDAALGGPFLASKDALNDPWMQPYKYDAAGAKNKGAKPDIWTVTPDKVVIGNWPGANVKDEAVGSVTIYRTIKPVTTAEIKAGRQTFFGATFKYTEEKIGECTLCEQYIETNVPGQPKEKTKTFTKQAFCVFEGKGKTVLSGSTADLRAVLERNHQPGLSPDMERALKKVGDSTLYFVGNPQTGFSATEKEKMSKELGVPASALDGVQAVTVQANEASGKLKLSAALICKDAAGAAEAKKVVDAGLTKGKGDLDDKLKNPPKDLKPDDLQTIKEARNLLDGVKVSAQKKSAQVTVEFSVEPATAVRVIWALGSVSNKDTQKKKEPDVKKTPVEKSTNNK